MTHHNHSAPAGACSPDTDRAGTDAAAPLPEWLVHALALIIYFLRTYLPHYRNRVVPDWWDYRPDLPLGSAQQLAASIRGEFGNAIVWMCRRRGIGPGHPDWPELARAIVAYGGSIAGFRPGLPACGLQWWENPDVVPGMIGADRPTPSADVMASLLSRLEQAGVVPLTPVVAPAASEPPQPPVPLWPIVPRATTGPPTGPPPIRGRSFHPRLDARGRSTAGPAVLIRFGYIATSQRYRRLATGGLRRTASAA